MELVEIEGLFQMDPGAPSPVIVSNDNHLYVSFYSSQSTDDHVLKERNFVYDEGAITLKFHLCRHYSFGGPNDETLNGHPYYKLGLRSYSFYEVKGSDLIRQRMKIASVHPRQSELNWRDYKHFILTFHDNMFECVATGFEVKQEKTSIYKEVHRILNEISASQF